MDAMIAAASAVAPGHHGEGLSSKERLILRCLVDEPEGRRLARYRSDKDYAPKFQKLLDRKLIKENDAGELKLTTEGKKVMRAYLLSILTPEE
jgi:hypothetical protein